MTDEEIIAAAKTIEAELVTLKPRLPEPYASNVAHCQSLARDIIDEMEGR